MWFEKYAEVRRLGYADTMLVCYTAVFSVVTQRCSRLTLCRLAFALAWRAYQIGLLFTHEDGDFDFLRKARFQTFVAYIRDFKIQGREGNANVS